MTRFFVRHPVTTWMVFLTFVVLAAYAVPRIEIEAMPDVDLPSLSVTTRWPGASPKAVQRSITLPIEQAVRRIHGVESITSTSSAGESVVKVELRRDVDLDFARLDLNEQLGSVRRALPANTGQPQILATVPEEFKTEQFFTVRVESELGPNELRETAEKWVVPQVLAVEGVADAVVRGGARPLLEIRLDRHRLERYGIGADEVFAAIDALDQLSGAGAVRTDGLERLVALRSLVDLDRIAHADIVRRGGHTYRLDDLGTVHPTFEDPSYFVRSDGRNVVELQVSRRSGANAVAVSRALRAALPGMAARAPADIRLEVDQDEGQDLEDKLYELIVRSIAILVLLFLLLVVTLRQVQLTAVVIVSIVFALVICLSLFYFLELSVNFITISGLTICFGMLLDNSILVLDSIHRRVDALDDTAYARLSRSAQLRVALETVVAGTGDVRFPILATTLTTVVAFASFIFLSGRLALYYVPLAVSVGTAMLASVFVAFGWIPVVLNQTWVPRLARRTGHGSEELDSSDAVAAEVEESPDLDRPPTRTERALGWSQRLWWLVLPAVAAVLVWGGFIYRDKVIKGGFWRQPDQQKLIFFMRMPDGTDVRVSSETMLKFERELLPLERGAHMRATVFGNQAYMEVEFDEFLLSTGIPLLYRSRLMEVADQTGGSAIFIAGFSDTPYVRGNLSGSALNSLVKITGYNSKRLLELADTTVAKVSRNRRVRNPRITGSERFGRSTNEENVITLDRAALAENGVSVLEVVTYVRRLLGVDTPWTMLIDGEQERVQLGFADADTIQFSDLASEVMLNSTGTRVRLADLVTMETVPLSDAITRENQRYSLLVNWEYVGTERMRSSFIKNVIATMDLPYGYAAEESRRQFLTQEEESDLELTIALAAAFILMVMAAMFESVALPLLVLTSLPMALVGVVLIFWQTTSSFDSSAQIGLVLLFGVVVNNAILLVSRFRSESALVLKAKLGVDPERAAALFAGQRGQIGGADLWYLAKSERAQLLRGAIARGTLVRLRSILLTSGTTIAGLIPLLIRVEWTPSTIAWLGDLSLPVTLSLMNNESQDIWQNLALTSVGGLLSSTVLILLAIPPLYYASVRIGWLVRSVFGWLRPRPGSARAVEQPTAASA